jgi:hypothetical protein
MTDTRNGNKSTLAPMSEDLEERRKWARFQKLALSDQATQRAANAVPLAQRRPWWPLLGRNRAG